MDDIREAFPFAPQISGPACSFMALP